MSTFLLIFSNIIDLITYHIILKETAKNIRNILTLMMFLNSLHVFNMNDQILVFVYITNLIVNRWII